MKRWTSSLRLPELGRSVWHYSSAQKICERSKCALPPLRSYSTALREDPRDEHSSPATTSAHRSVGDAKSSVDASQYGRRIPLAKHSFASAPLAYRLTLSTGARLRPRRHLIRDKRLKLLVRTGMRRKRRSVTTELPILRGIPIRGWLQSTWNPTLDVRAIEWVALVIEQLESGQRAISLYEPSLANSTDSIRMWVQVALWLLANDKPKMMQFLRATHVEPHIPGTYIQDSLLLLALYWSQSQNVHLESDLTQLADAFVELSADRRTDDRLSFFNPFVRILIQFARDDQIRRMYETLARGNVSTSWNTYLHFTTYFAKLSDIETAFDALLKARDLGCPLNSYAFRSNCATLLRKSSEQPDGLRVCLRIVSTLVDMGVELNKPICDIIMLNAVEAGDLKTAFSVYHSLMERGLQPDGRTFAVLLKGCKSNIDDAVTLNDTIRNAINNIDVRKSELVASEILHCLMLHHFKHNPATAFNTLVEAYSQLFDTRPLQELGIMAASVPQTQSPSEPRMMPTHQNALNIMLTAKIQHIQLHDRNPQPILSLYEHWRKQVEAGHAQLVNLATSDYTANIFLMAFIRKPNGLIHATHVIRDMQQPLPESAGVEQSKPTVQSWSILLHGFGRHGKTHLAEQVLTYMRGQGIQPNPVTWTGLIMGYARAQDEEGTIDALRRAEQGGFVWNEWAYGGLSALRDRTRLRAELEERSRLQQRLDFSTELKQGLGERLLGSSDETIVQPSLDEGRRDMSETAHSIEEGQDVGKGFASSSADLAEQTPYRPFKP